MTNASIICIIVKKFGAWKKFSLVILFIIGKGLEVGFYDIVLFFYLINNLRIEGR